MTNLSVRVRLLNFLKLLNPSFWRAENQRRRSAKSVRRHFQHVMMLAAQDESSNAITLTSENGPTFSFVVPTFNTETDFLNDLFRSFKSQKEGLSELILSDDGSTAMPTRKWLDRHTGIKNLVIVQGESNRGIAAATNSGIERASGQWIGLLDHDDALAPFVVSRLMKELKLKPDCQFLYTDEVITDRKLRPVSYFFKPAWDPVLLSGVNYINHLSLYRRERLKGIGGLRAGFEGSQDYDLVLRYTAGLADREIIHLPFPGYFWRRSGESYSARLPENAMVSARKALAEHYRRDGKQVQVCSAVSNSLHRVRFDLNKTEWPLVSIIIPNRNSLSLVRRLLDGLTSKTDYPSLEIIVVDNGTTDDAVLALYDQYQRGPVFFRALINKEIFNFSRSVNRGIKVARGEFVLLLNNDIEILESGWLKEMVSCFEYPNVGIVGAKLLYPNRSIQHAGVIIGLGGLAGHWYVGREEKFSGQMGRLWVRQSLSAVTGACMLLSRRCLDVVGTFDEQKFPVAYNDIDFCLRAGRAGFRVIWTPFAKLVHYESASRGSDELPENVDRFANDKEQLRHAHQTEKFEDRAFSPWFAKDRSDPAPIRLAELPPGR